MGKNLNKGKIGRIEACKTFVEQTKLLVSLASAFVIAPPVVLSFMKIGLDWKIYIAETLFILSVLSGYVALGAIAGSQHVGSFDVHRKAVKRSGLIQFVCYVAGLALFLFWVLYRPDCAPCSCTDIKVN